MSECTGGEEVSRLRWDRDAVHDGLPEHAPWLFEDLLRSWGSAVRTVRMSSAQARRDVGGGDAAQRVANDSP